MADREGRLKDRIDDLKWEILPSDSCNIEALLIELITNKLINRYSVDNESFIEIPSFKEHQNPHKQEKPSNIPINPESSKSSEQVRNKFGSRPADSCFPHTDTLLVNDHLDNLETLYKSFGHKLSRTEQELLEKWLTEYTIKDILPTVLRMKEWFTKKEGKSPENIKIYDKAIREDYAKNHPESQISSNLGRKFRDI